MKGICIDLGASSTRVTDETAVIYELPNYLIFKDRSEVVDLEVSKTGDKQKDFLAGMDIVIDKTSGETCKAFPSRALVGDLATRFSPAVNRPSVMMNKSKQNINYFNIIVAAVHQAYINGYSNEQVTLYVAFPPLEVTKDTKDEVSKLLCGTYNIKLDKLNTSIDLQVVDVKCFPESYMALAAFYYEFPSGKQNTDAVQKYGKGYVMSLDIGASTADVSIAKDKVLQEKSGQTIKTGCNVIEMDIANSIRAKYGYDPTHEDLTTAICEGRLPMGNGYVDVSDMLRKAKREFARTIVVELQNYFRLVNIPLQSIRAIITSGGGSITSGYVDDNNVFIQTCACVSEFITTELKNIVENIDVLAMQDPRTANVRGLYIRMMAEIALLKAKQVREQAESNAQIAGAVTTDAVQ